MLRFALHRFTLVLAAALLLAVSACDSGDPAPPMEDTTPPSAPASLVGSSEDGAVTLEWTAPSDDDLDGYRVYRSDQSFSGVDAATQVSGGGLVSGESYTDDSAENGTTYVYRVAAVDEAGNESDLSGMVEKTPFPGPPDEP